MSIKKKKSSVTQYNGEYIEDVSFFTMDLLLDSYMNNRADYEEVHLKNW